MGKGVYKCSAKDCRSLLGFTNSAGLRSHMREIHTNLREIALLDPPIGGTCNWSAGRSDYNLDSMMENWTADETSAKRRIVEFTRSQVTINRASPDPRHQKGALPDLAKNPASCDSSSPELSHRFSSISFTSIQ
jgi:hypothetical protein